MHVYDLYVYGAVHIHVHAHAHVHVHVHVHVHAHAYMHMCMHMFSSLSTHSRNLYVSHLVEEEAHRVEVTLPARYTQRYEHIQI